MQQLHRTLRKAVSQRDEQIILHFQLALQHKEAVQRLLRMRRRFLCCGAFPSLRLRRIKGSGGADVWGRHNLRFS